MVQRQKEKNMQLFFEKEKINSMKESVEMSVQYLQWFCIVLFTLPACQWMDMSVYQWCFAVSTKQVGAFEETD